MKKDKEVQKKEKEIDNFEDLEVIDLNEEVQPEKKERPKILPDVFRCFCWDIIFGLLLIFASVIGFTTKLFSADFLKTATNIIQDGEADAVASCIEMGITQTVPVASLITFAFVLIIIFSRRKKEMNLDVFGLKQKLAVKQIVFYVVAAIILNVSISYGIKLLPEEWISSYDSSTSYLEICNFWTLLITTGILAPIYEEYFFRGIMVIESRNYWVAAVISSVLFGINHGNWIQSLFAFALGIWFCLENERHNSIKPSLLMHIAINCSTIIMSQIL